MVFLYNSVVTDVTLLLLKLLMSLYCIDITCYALCIMYIVLVVLVVAVAAITHY